MKKTIKSIMALTALVTMTIAITSCKKEEPAPTINFNNATAQYVESFLGKSTEEFKKACEESGMIIYENDNERVGYKNGINGIDASIIKKNNTITVISYIKEDTKENNITRYKDFLEYNKNNNYADFRGWNEQKICYKNPTEYNNSLNSDITSSNCTFVKAVNATHMNLDKKSIRIEYISKDCSEIYEEYKSEAMSSCN